jgi:hypothetical protein
MHLLDFQVLVSESLHVLSTLPSNKQFFTIQVYFKLHPSTNFVMNCMGSIKKLGLLYTCHNFCWEDGFRTKVATDFTMDTNFVINCIGSIKMLVLLYTSLNFR